MLILPQKTPLETLSGLCLVVLSNAGSCFNFRDSSIFSNSPNNCHSQPDLTMKLTSSPKMSDSLL